MKKEHPWEIEPQVYPLIYGLVRAIIPNQVVETGTFTGKATASIAKALKGNKKGHLWSIDIKDFGAWGYLEDRKLTEKDLEWLEYNVPFTINIYEQLQKIENKLDKPFSAVVKQKLRKMKLDRVKV